MHTLTSMIGVGPMPWTKIVQGHHMVKESGRIRVPRPPTQLSHAEDDVRRRAEARAQRSLDAGVKKADKDVDVIKGLHAEFLVNEVVLGHLDTTRYVGPHGESLSTPETAGKLATWTQKVSDDEDEGSVAHRRTDPRDKKFYPAILCADIVVLTLIWCKILNVNFRTFWTEPGGWIKAGTALTFGLVGTFALSIVMTHLGKHHRSYRASHGGWDFSGGNRRMLIGELAATFLVIILVAAVMAARVVAEATGPQSTMLLWLLAVLFAALMSASAYLAYKSEFNNGSLLTDKIDVLAPQVHVNDATKKQVETKQSILLETSGKLTGKLERHLVKTSSAALASVEKSREDRTIRYARSIHQQMGASGQLPAPRLDFSGLELALQQAKQLRRHQDQLEVLDGNRATP
ncbi:hypothetical protein V3G39_17850 (plasmid) [Dermatophilaceae bacterium Sec6.4]